MYFDTDRYPAYTAQVTGLADPVYVTANSTALVVALLRAFEQLGITYQRRDFGPYTVFYGLSRPVTPAELGFR